jgi:hypothetical protein
MFDPPSWGYLSVVCKTGPQIYDPQDTLPRLLTLWRD